ncbi:MAG: hypothetical protein R3C51_01670 [Parvularculaceae bacterium]
MTEIENLLTDDFARLLRRFNNDEFTTKLLARLKSADRLRVVGVGAAGGVGAAFAASQFGAVADLFARTAPKAAMALKPDSAFAAISADAAIMTTPTVLAALAFAIVGVATALVMPNSR